MFDPVYELTRLRNKENKLNLELDDLELNEIKSGTPKSAIINYNPFEGLVTNVIPSFYETLSLYHAFSPIVCNPGIDPVKFVVMDLDDSVGFSMATQLKYPNSVIYSIYDKPWPLDLSQIGDKTRFNLESSTPISLVDRTLYNNRRGIPLSFGSDNESKDVTLDRLSACIRVLQRGGWMLFKINDYRIWEDSWESIANNFEDMHIYKPATTPCYLPIGYFVGERRRITPGNTNNNFNQQVTKLEDNRKYAIESINNRTTRKKDYDVEFAKTIYKGFT
jgi:hypothetical protein